MSALENRTVIMSGGSRGIGLAIAKRVAREGARVALLAKTDQPHPKLEGTIHTAAEEIEAAGGEALAIVGDVRDEERVNAAVAETVERFGGIDIVVNNASAINLAPMRDLEPKRLDLMLDINVRGTFLLTRAALPHLRESDHAHVLTLSPPLSADPKWLRGHSAYTISKMGMTMLTLGARGRRGRGRHRRELPVAAHADRHRRRAEPARRRRGDARGPHAEIYADAAFEVLRRDPRECTGNAYIDDEVLAEAGITDLSGYQADPSGELALDLFVDGWPA